MAFASSDMDASYSSKHSLWMQIISVELSQSEEYRQMQRQPAPHALAGILPEAAMVECPASLNIPSRTA
jgi:hypothetical protein